MLHFKFKNSHFPTNWARFLRKMPQNRNHYISTGHDRPIEYQNRFFRILRPQPDRPHPKITPRWSIWGCYGTFSPVDGCGRLWTVADGLKTSCSRLLVVARGCSRSPVLWQTVHTQKSPPGGRYGGVVSLFHLWTVVDGSGQLWMVVGGVTGPTAGAHKGNRFRWTGNRFR